AKTTYTGFTPQTITQGTIAGDGSTVVNVFYTRNSYTLAWVTDGNALSGNYTQGSVKFGANITAPNTPTKTGYTFKAWNPAVSSTMPAENTTYTATWDPATNTAYTVEHYQETLAGTYPTTATESENKTGTTGQNTVAAAKTYTGFTAQSFSQATIAANGSTVVKIYYKRNSYTLGWDAAGGQLSGGTAAGSVKFGATITAPTATKQGYTFDAWTPEFTGTMPAANTTYTATWTAATNTQYFVKHYQQNIENDQYTEVEADRQTLTGTTGQNTAAEAKTYTGFTAQEFSQTTIAADGNTVVSIYYNRQKFTVIFKNYDGAELLTLNDVKYGATPVYTGDAPAKPSDAENDYVWENVWSPALGAISGNTTFTATFTTVPKSFFLISEGVTPAGTGHINGVGSYESGSVVTLTAVSDDNCYVFDHWADNNSTNPERQVTVTANATYTAVFRVLQHTITIKSSDDTKGTVSFQ
ncbi:MAG: InlB B-repeat-containing protein, partial [Paludibacteraceae bacterium]|nr:InlB B-repeat-containing protein [Paludibacteraceae bacterium]